MPTYLFNYKTNPYRVSWKVQARDLEAARLLLYFHARLDDPFGHIIELHHMTDNFQVMTEKTEAEENINEVISDWGFSWLVLAMQ